jgi:hypothetical protein
MMNESKHLYKEMMAQITPDEKLVEKTRIAMSKRQTAVAKQPYAKARGLLLPAASVLMIGAMIGGVLLNIGNDYDYLNPNLAAEFLSDDMSFLIVGAADDMIIEFDSDGEAPGLPEIVLFESAAGAAQRFNDGECEELEELGDYGVPAEITGYPGGDEGVGNFHEPPVDCRRSMQFARESACPPCALRDECPRFECPENIVECEGCEYYADCEDCEDCQDYTNCQ